MATASLDPTSVSNKKHSKQQYLQEGTVMGSGVPCDEHATNISKFVRLRLTRQAKFPPKFEDNLPTKQERSNRLFDHEHKRQRSSNQ